MKAGRRLLHFIREAQNTDHCQALGNQIRNWVLVGIRDQLSSLEHPDISLRVEFRNIARKLQSSDQILLHPVEAMAFEPAPILR